MTKIEVALHRDDTHGLSRRRQSLYARTEDGKHEFQVIFRCDEQGHVEVHDFLDAVEDMKLAIDRYQKTL